MSRETPCVEREDALTALALGELTGEERAELLAHVEGCPHCAGLLEHLSSAADALLELAPDAEPSLGLEVRVAEAIGRERARPRRTRRRAVLGVAAAFLALCGLGAGLLINNTTTDNPAPIPAAVAVFSTGSSASGEVMAYAGHPDRLVVTVDGSRYQGAVDCLVVTSSGQRVFVGRFWLNGGSDWWPATAPAGSSSLKTAMLVTVGSHPSIVARGSFSSSV